MSESDTRCCSFAVTGANTWWQPIYVCHDCEDEEDHGQCICATCAEMCHGDHDVEYIGMGPSYCDCGKTCTIAKLSNDTAEALEIASWQVAKKNDDIVETRTYHIAGLEDRDIGELLAEQAIALAKFPHDTFWISSDHNGQGLCELEQLALAILKNHASIRDLGCVLGVEWWVQVKFLSSDNAAVDLHYDKDENLAEKFGLGYFPFLSTVTYFTDHAYPTLIFPRCYNDPDDNHMESFVVSSPRRGKHLVFDGRLLHGAPACKAMCQSETEAVSTGPRITFLVNFWQTAKPCGIKSLDENVRGLLVQMAETTGREKALNPEMKSTKIETLHVDKEEDLRPDYSERVFLPFVSKDATWGTENELDPSLVLVTFPPPHFTSFDTVLVRFGDGMQAYLEYQDDGVEEVDDDVRSNHEPYTDCYI